MTCCMSARRDHFGAGFDARHLAQRHQQQTVRLEPDHFGFDRRRVAPAAANLAEFTDLRGRADAFDDQPDHLRDQPIGPNRVQPGHDGAVAGEVNGGRLKNLTPPQAATLPCYGRG